jgi:hypothetical protein
MEQPRPHGCPMPDLPPVCAVINRSGAGIAGTIACARAAGSHSAPSPPMKRAIGS